MLPVPVTVVRPRPGARWDASAPRWPTSASTARTGRPSGAPSSARSWPADPGSCPRHDRRPPIKLPPNPIRHFYRGGPAIAELRGIDVGGDHSPEEWIGSASTLFGESERGLSRLPDGALVRDALAADPEGWLGAAHAARFGAEPRAAGQAARRRRAPARPPPPRRRLRARAPRPGLRQDRGVDRHRGARGRAGRRRLARGRRARTRCARWVARRRTTTRCSARCNPLAGERGRRGLRPRRRRPTRSATGILIVELQEPTDLSILLEWEGFGIDDEQAGDAGPRLGRRAGQRRARRARREALRGPRADGAVAELLPAAAAPFFSAQRVAPGGGSVAAARRLRGRHRRRRRRHPRRPRRDPRRRACSCPMPRGPSAPTATSWPSPVAPRRCRRRDRAAARHRRRHLGLQGRGRRRPRGRGGARPGAHAVGAGADGRRGRSRRAARRRRAAPPARRSRSAPEGRVAGIGVTSVAETGMLLDADGPRPAPAHRLARRPRDRRGAGAGARPAGLQRAHRPARQRAVLAGQAQAPRHRTARRAGSTSPSGSCTASAGGRSQSSRSPRAPACSTSTRRAPYADALAWADLPGDLLAERRPRGHRRGAQRRRRRCPAPRAPSSPWPATTTSSPAWGSA